MKSTRIVILAFLAIGSDVYLHTAIAQRPAGIKHTELQRADLVVPGREVVQMRVELDASATVIEIGKPLVVRMQ